MRPYAFGEVEHLFLTTEGGKKIICDLMPLAKLTFCGNDKK
jgi:hypothetical protein